MPDERSFYEIESTEQNWNLRELRCQFDSGLYERLALSRDKEGDIPTAIPEKVERLLGPVISSARENAAERSPDEWDRFEAQLVRWEQDPVALEDDGLEPPNQETIPLIREVSHALRDLAVEPPLRLVPNCEAGAVFEWRTAPFLWSVEVERDGSLELSIFRTGRLVTRYRIA